MHKTNAIVMRAPKRAIFETAANLELWPKILPHYRYIQFLERGPDRNIVVMAARRSGIPISWTSEQIIDRNKLETLMRQCEEAINGQPINWRQAIDLVRRLREVERDLGLRMRSREVRQAAENI